MTEHRESTLAWAATTISVLYFAWRGATLFRVTKTLRAMFEGLGAELPMATRLGIEYRVWILSIVFGLPALIVLGKELAVRNKRTSMMITMLVVITVLFLADILATIYYLPLFSIIDKLS